MGLNSDDYPKTQRSEESTNEHSLNQIADDLKSLIENDSIFVEGVFRVPGSTKNKANIKKLISRKLNILDIAVANLGESCKASASIIKDEAKERIKPVLENPAVKAIKSKGLETAHKRINYYLKIKEIANRHPNRSLDSFFTVSGAAMLNTSHTRMTPKNIATSVADAIPVEVLEGQLELLKQHQGLK